ncbi:hypothetical protein P175DRAFT_0529984 [Aspergillus ochraceoroseus IBT 24754]|uniref:CENP-V/GFA domain-containing protein n=2 Tax=Aspergillus ochraceoroseus TaxID=138278 RepID=A0A2T5M2Z8_9EURO|nr:uncharacterized protein P175DRAFT_0529984 [Aspergillus ochraceoroseus IBT 24754]KKK22534.1 hypothetical protein AOCH_005512 [Aspergillus ochraceoroseus]PTU22898.1 hypothetical protein P175DRAFT_0529984 [Aspergillus ochraceoroseus IBT 24754]
MDQHEPLHGSCHCGRNQYLIRIPDDVTEHARIYFDSGRDNRRFYGTPLTAWLRVPLTWYQSHTQSYFPDETHRTIRRIFSPHNAPHTQRVFCGVCGTPLTYWSEIPQGESDYMSVTIGSLRGDDQRMLEDLELLPTSDESEESTAEPNSSSQSSTVAVPSAGLESGLTRTYREGTTGGIPWFEEMIEGSKLGRLMKTRRGVGVSDDQSTTIEWEVSEWTDAGPGEGGSSTVQAVGKRKRGQHQNTEG